MIETVPRTADAITEAPAMHRWPPEHTHYLLMKTPGCSKPELRHSQIGLLRLFGGSRGMVRYYDKEVRLERAMKEGRKYQFGSHAENIADGWIGLGR
jgi:hypothetical protein